MQIWGDGHAAAHLHHLGKRLAAIPGKTHEDIALGAVLESSPQVQALKVSVVVFRKIEADRLALPLLPVAYNRLPHAGGGSGK